MDDMTLEEFDAKIEELDRLIYCANDNLQSLKGERILYSIYRNHLLNKEI